MNFAEAFAHGHTYPEFLATYGTDVHRQKWQSVYDRVQLTEAQRELLGSFQRELNVLCLAGTWCGDCVEQCPIFRHFEEAAPVIHVRYVDREASDDLKQRLLLCGGARVPQLVFLNEEGQFVGQYGDRTLAKYRDMMAKQFGASCPTGITANASLLSAVVQDWLNEFERVAWLLRTSPRLREKHGD